MRVADKPFILYISPETNDNNPVARSVTKFFATRKAADDFLEAELVKYKASGITTVKWWHGEMTEFHKVSVEWVRAEPLIVDKNSDVATAVQQSKPSSIEV